MSIRTIMAVAALAAATMTLARAQGAEIYKSKCQMCHGGAGMADSGAGKAMKVKPVTDPDVKKMSEAQMIAAVKNGMGKMQAYKGQMSDAQIKESVNYFRTLIK